MKKYKNIDDYIKNTDKTYRGKLIEIRKLIKDNVPDVKEEIAYGMPGYKWKEKPLFYFASMKKHLGIYPTPSPIRKHKDLLKNFSTSKGCIRIPYDSKTPKNIILKLIKTRIEEIKEEEKTLKKQA